MLPEHIHITPDIATKVTEVVSKGYSKVAVLLDENTRKHCYPIIQSTLPPHLLIEIESGEKNKTLETCRTIWQHLTEGGFDRHSLLITLGGGVIGDMGGFAAATYKRGIDFILLPTTLLSQVDASVGGKLGVDFQGFKNHIGLFQDPKHTVIAPIFLNTLPANELRSGFAEIIKHCLIGDAARWDSIRQANLEGQDWESLISASINFKISVTKEDPREKGLRKILNFGHTIGHAIESNSLNNGNPLLHGEAIAAGMISEAHIAKQRTFISSEELDQIVQYIKSIFDTEKIGTDAQIMSMMRHDKKNKENKILMALVKPIGQAIWDVEVSEKEVCNSLAYYRSL